MNNFHLLIIFICFVLIFLRYQSLYNSIKMKISRSPLMKASVSFSLTVLFCWGFFFVIFLFLFFFVWGALNRLIILCLLSQHSGSTNSPTARPNRVKSETPKLLHKRLFITSNTETWIIKQSTNLYSFCTVCSSIPRAHRPRMDKLQ